LASALLQLETSKPRLADLYQASNDHALARQSGLRTRSIRSPAQVLSPRELEVLELLARGFRNKDVAQALVISPSTTKVHVRHILEKLGVRTRTEAVARFTSEGWFLSRLGLGAFVLDFRHSDPVGARDLRWG